MSPRTLTSAMSRLRRPAVMPDPWSSYLAAIEPALAAEPRVHRFARPPVLGDPDLPAASVSVWIDGDLGDAEQTRHALEGGTTVPASLLDGPLADALATTRAEHVLLVRGGDEPAAIALERFGQAAALAPDADVITCDDDALTPGRARQAPRFRPGPSPDRWLACDDSGPMLMVRREPAAAVAGALGADPAWRHELALRLAGHGGERHAHVPVLLCHTGAASSDPPALSAAVVEDILTRIEPGARVRANGSVRTVSRFVAAEPAVEVIVCFRDRPELLTRCVASVLARSDYDRLRITLVDNGSEHAETEDAVRRLSRDPRVRVRRDEQPFNFAALNNAAVSESDADVLVFLNNDTEILSDDWIGGLLEHAVRPQIGGVAPLLLYPNGTVQHAGAALGLHGYAGHPFAGLAPSAQTPFGVADGGTRNWLAVSAACMMVERAKFLAVGGFDESFAVGGNDVDLCLRLTAAGHRSLCVPDVSLLHDESRSRGTHVAPGDFAASERSYGAFRTVGDPFYNPNLTLSGTDCSVRTPE
jgi:GT2 family glycosyltransferase